VPNIHKNTISSHKKKGGFRGKKTKKKQWGEEVKSVQGRHKQLDQAIPLRGLRKFPQGGRGGGVGGGGGGGKGGVGGGKTFPRPNGLKERVYLSLEGAELIKGVNVRARREIQGLKKRNLFDTLAKESKT